ncbi:hypothetical protein AXF42_Ash020203 [Apostasia shenzhenica]|uniref:Uncharacterized protein n=1 Tax=Apostasia shenzhenica TaxID=1088818 RepID=A0A2H9ZWW2_9ASPA|nr:hypothetical protein AXF42_Ash020203 [Apostasia shenzhenica]
MSSQFIDLKKSFRISIQSLLTALSKEDVHGAFSMHTNAEKECLHRLLILVIKALHKNLEEKFEFECQERQVWAIFDKLERLVEEQKLDTLHADETFIRDLKEKVSTVKMDEIQNLKSLLQKVEEQNTSMEAQIQSLKETQFSVDSKNAVEKVYHHYHYYHYYRINVLSSFRDAYRIGFAETLNPPR